MKQAEIYFLLNNIVTFIGILVGGLVFLFIIFGYIKELIEDRKEKKKYGENRKEKNVK